jgi:hypothetical protein
MGNSYPDQLIEIETIESYHISLSLLFRHQFTLVYNTTILSTFCVGFGVKIQLRTFVSFLPNRHREEILMVLLRCTFTFKSIASTAIRESGKSYATAQGTNHKTKFS